VKLSYLLAIELCVNPFLRWLRDAAAISFWIHFLTIELSVMVGHYDFTCMQSVWAALWIGRAWHRYGFRLATFDWCERSVLGWMRFAVYYGKSESGRRRHREFNSARWQAAWRIAFGRCPLCRSVAPTNIGNRSAVNVIASLQPAYSCAVCQGIPYQGDGYAGGRQKKRWTERIAPTLQGLA
jgi:hypothetical protein